MRHFPQTKIVEILLWNLPQQLTSQARYQGKLVICFICQSTMLSMQFWAVANIPCSGRPLRWRRSRIPRTDTIKGYAPNQPTVPPRQGYRKCHCEHLRSEVPTNDQSICIHAILGNDWCCSQIHNKCHQRVWQQGHSECQTTFTRLLKSVWQIQPYIAVGKMPKSDT